MQLTIKHPKAREMAEELARLTGESVSEAVVHALEARLDEERNKCAREGKRREEVYEALMALAEECQALPVYDDRHPDEMLYDKDGLPKPRDER